jgi:hypothetical protein
MVTVEWPCPVSPGIRPFRLTVPAGWSAVETPDVLLALFGHEEDGFRTNLVVTGQRLPETVELGPLADGALRDCDPESVDGPVLDRDGHGSRLPVAVRRGIETAGGRRLVRLAVVAGAPDASPAGLRSVFTLIGTCLAERAALDEPVLTDAIASFATGSLPPAGQGRSTIDAGL